MNYSLAKLDGFKSTIVVSILLFVVSLAIYFPSLSNDFVWDDTGSIKHKYSYKSFIKSLKPTSFEKKRNYYRPTVYLSYSIDSSIWGRDPYGYHLSNNIFNAAVVVLLFWFVYYFFIDIGYKNYAFTTAVFASVLFLTHPIHVESVSWVSARTDVLCTLFMMIGMLAHLKIRSKQSVLIISVMAFYMSMLSKELGILFLPLILVIDFATGQIKKRSSISIYLIYVLSIIVYFYIRSQGHVNITDVSDKNVETAAASSFTTYLSILKVLIITYYTYIYKILWPVELNSFIYDIVTDTYYFIGAVIYLMLTGLILIYSFIRKLPIIYLSLFWFLLTLGPSSVLSVIKMTPTSIAERYLYLPSIGFCIVLGYMFTRLIFTKKYKLVGVAVLVIVLSFYSISTIKRQKVWASDLTLWKDSAEKSENACFPHNNYGTALRKAGKIDEAINQYLYIKHPDIKCRDPERSLLYNNFGVALTDINKTDEARKYFEDAIRISKYYYSPHLNLGTSYLSTALISKSSEDFKRAEYYLTNAIELKPSSAASHHYLSIVYKETGRFNLAQIHAEKALKLGLPKAQKRDSLRILDEIQNSDIKEY